VAPVALAAAVAAGCADRGSGPDVLLVTLDTTRADHLGAYGRPDVRTPHLDRLARAGGQFEMAIGDVPVTLPSHTTIHTGVPAVGHGVRYNGDFRVGPDAETLAERFVDAGYATAAVVSAMVLAAEFGLDQGFDRFDDELTPGYERHDESRFSHLTHWLPTEDRRAEEVTDLAVAWLGTVADRSWFLWAHYYDPHAPFDPPPPWGNAHADHYASEIQYTDHHVGRLLRRVRGERPEAIVVVTADHGEGLDQHREDRHGILIYDEVVHVPLIVSAPGRVAPGVVRSEQVRTVDVAPTLLDLAAAPSAIGVGGSLRPLLEGTGAPPDSVAYSESMKSRLFYNGSGLMALRTRHAKYVWAPRPELYDLVEDPGETRNLAPIDPDRAEAMRQRLEDYVRDILDRELAVVEAANLDESTAESLRSLGYVTGSAGDVTPGSVADEMALPGLDPKDLVDAVLCGRDARNGFYERALSKARRFRDTVATPEADPDLAPLWSLLLQNEAAAYMGLGRFGAAAESYRGSLRWGSANPSSRWGLVFALNLDGRPAEAEREAARILSDAPGAWRVRLHGALALALLGRTGDARAVFANLAETTTDAEVREVAALYRDKLGTPEERRYLDLYLSSEGAAAP